MNAQAIFFLIVIALIVTVLTSPVFWALVGVVLIGWAIMAYQTYYWNEIWPNKYFSSEEFLEQKNKITDYVDDCNSLNDHIGELKALQENIQTSNKGSAKLKDTSNFNYQRQSWNNQIAGSHVYDCSRTIVTNARNNPFKYPVKYFKVKTNEETLQDFEVMLNDFSAAEEGAQLLDEKREELIQSISDQIHERAKAHHSKRLRKELGFEKVIFDELSFPSYSFQYISAGGNSSARCDIEFDPNQIEDFIDYLDENIKFKKSVAGQRSLMTRALRERIKERDDFTCKKCGANIYEERNLLLEIDHMMPLSKGGTSVESNLQTLCWRCNRTKGSKVETTVLLEEQ
jgi:hypothetical protein